MRLLHTEKLYFEEFFDIKIPKYAILSHCWEDAEVSFQDFEGGKKKDGAGYRKILHCCALAISEGYEWVWIDTCCIDKKSSAELSETINSMYRWYENAAICYAYLSDVQNQSVDGCGVAVSFSQSKWFTRGWTLQELLAPKQVLFLDRRWEVIGSKIGGTGMMKRENLSQSLSKITGVPEKTLSSGGFDPILSTSSVAQRMSWAAGRKTSRKEDEAYCLLGLFNINMPLLYGEGGKAFVRLQQEIIKQSDDESIFAWIAPLTSHLHQDSIFASSPNYFARSGGVERRYYTSWIKRSSYVLTDLSVHMDVHLIPLCDREEERWLLPLNCETRGRRNTVVLCRYHDELFWKVLPTKALDFIDEAGLERGISEWEDRNQMKQRRPDAIKAQHSDSTIHTALTKATPLQNRLHRIRWEDAEANFASGLDTVKSISILRHCV
jgi:hypothetical protein